MRVGCVHGVDRPRLTTPRRYETGGDPHRGEQGSHWREADSPVTSSANTSGAGLRRERPTPHDVEPSPHQMLDYEEQIDGPLERPNRSNEPRKMASAGADHTSTERIVKRRGTLWGSS